MLIVAPNRVVKVVGLADYAKSLVGVVEGEARLALVEDLALGNGNTPELDGDVLVASINGGLEVLTVERNSLAIEVGTMRGTSNGEDGRSEIDVRGDNLGNLALGNTRAANDQGDVDVLFEATLLARVAAMLADGVAVICSVNDEGVVKDVVLLQTLDDVLDQLVDRLQGSQALAIEMVIVINVLLVLLLQFANPVSTGGEVGVEVGSARDLDVLEQILVTLSGDGGTKLDEIPNVGNVIPVWFITEDDGGNIAVRGNRGDAEKERTIAGVDSIVKETEGLLVENINCVMALVALRLVLVALIGGVQVVVSPGVEKEVGAIPCLWISNDKIFSISIRIYQKIQLKNLRFVVVFGGMCVEELASVVCVVAGLLEPNGEIVLVEPLSDKLGVTTVGWVYVGDVGVVGLLASQDGDSGRAADGGCAVMAFVECALVDEVLLDQGKVVERVHANILIVSQDEDNVGLLLTRTPVATEIASQWLLLSSSEDRRQTCR